MNKEIEEYLNDRTIEVPEATEEEKKRLREEFPKIKVTSNSRSGKSKRIHLIDEEGEVFCDRHSVTNLIEKDIGVYPRGYFPYCKDCLFVWRKLQE